MKNNTSYGGRFSFPDSLTLIPLTTDFIFSRWTEDFVWDR